jgi:Flp pilus assembly pilin Flp
MQTRRFVNDIRGATAIEYSVIAGFISILVLAAARSIGISVFGMISALASGFH